MTETTPCKTCKDMDTSSILSSSEIAERLSAHPLWALSDDGHLVRRFSAKTFKCAMDFLNLAGEVAESFGHHPDFHLTSYRNVEVVLYTHSVKGVTALDFDVLEQLDTLPVVYSPKWERENIQQTRKADDNR